MYLFIFEKPDYEGSYVNAILAENEQHAKDLYFLKARADAKDIDSVKPVKIELTDNTPRLLWSNEYFFELQTKSVPCIN